MGCKESPTFYSNNFRADVHVQLYDEHQYDFLWCLDSSGSMLPRRQYVRDNIQNFINIMNTRKAVDYQMAVVTTDFFRDAGALIQTPSGVSVVKSTDVNPAGEFQMIVDNVSGSKTAFWEQCLESVYQAVNQHRADFSRTGVQLNVIVVSDEDDWSCKSNCYGPEPEHNVVWNPFPVSRYINFLSQVKANEGAQINVFPIVGVNATDCGVASVGSRYIDVASQLGGLSQSGSICPSSFQQSYEAIAHTVADRGVRFPLDRPSTGVGISVYVDRVLIPNGDDGWVYEATTNSIVFMSRVPAKNSVVEITYNQTP